MSDRPAAPHEGPCNSSTCDALGWQDLLRLSRNQKGKARAVYVAFLSLTLPDDPCMLLRGRRTMDGAAQSCVSWDTRHAALLSC